MPNTDYNQLTSNITSQDSKTYTFRKDGSANKSINFDSFLFSEKYPFISNLQESEIIALSNKTGIQSEEIIKILGVCYSNNFFVMIRPTNSATKKITRELVSAQGKMMDIKAKSSTNEGIAG